MKKTKIISIDLMMNHCMTLLSHELWLVVQVCNFFVFGKLRQDDSLVFKICLGDRESEVTLGNLAIARLKIRNAKNGLEI